MTDFVDQTGRTVSIPEFPKKIISLVPSQTELLYTLGLDKEVIGITRFCIHPPHWRSSRQVVGGTKKLHLTEILRLAPDLIIANKEENTREEVEYLAERFPVWISDINTLPDAYHMIVELGKITGTASIAETLVEKIRNEFTALPSRIPVTKVAYLIWHKPLMVAGNNTFIYSMLAAAGLGNAFDNYERYPETSFDQLRSLQPSLVLLSSEPFPFNQKHVDEFEQQLPGTKVLLVDGEMFSWYGSRLLHAPSYFRQLLAGLDG